jgi:hypothetical protein
MQMWHSSTLDQAMCTRVVCCVLIECAHDKSIGWVAPGSWLGAHTLASSDGQRVARILVRPSENNNFQGQNPKKRSHQGQKVI